MTSLRVLHLIDPDHASVGPCAVAMLADTLSLPIEEVAPTALVIGGSNADRLAARLGIAPRDRMSSPAAAAWLSAPILRRYLARRGPFDLIHCWSLATLTLASLAGPGIDRVLTLTMGPDGSAEAHGLRILASRGRCTILAISNSVKRAWVQGGVDSSCVHVLRPGLNPGRFDRDTRDVCRRDWGATEGESMVVALLAHPASRADAWRAARILTIATLLEFNMLMVVSPAALRRHAAYRMALAGRSAARFIVDARADEPWKIVPAVDAVLVLGDDREPLAPPKPQSKLGLGWNLLAARTGGSARLKGARRSAQSPEELSSQSALEIPMPGVLPMLWAAAASCVIVAEASYAASEVIENRHSGLLVKPGLDMTIVRRLQQAASDRHLAWSLRDAAKSEAFSFFSRRRYASDLRIVYGQIVDRRPIAVPDLPVTGGLRFAGRA